MKNISIVISGPQYKEFDIAYSVSLLRKIFPTAELLLSSNDKQLLQRVNNGKEGLFDKVIECENTGELPSLKWPGPKDKVIICNNINKQISSSLKGINEAKHEVVLKLRTDQILLSDNILKLWEYSQSIPVKNNKSKGRIITSSVFSINPRYSERMPYHISDMLQLGFKEDLIRYYSAPIYPFEYAIWYENNPYAKYTNSNEKLFRSKYAVEQWLALHYIYRNEENFPIKFHNDVSPKLVEFFEGEFSDYFLIAHPEDIDLRVSKFESSRSYFNTQCYSTYESIEILRRTNIQANGIANEYTKKGINKKLYFYIKFILDLKIIHLIIKALPIGLKQTLKKMIS